MSEYTCELCGKVLPDYMSYSYHKRYTCKHYVTLRKVSAPIDLSTFLVDTYFKAEFMGLNMYRLNVDNALDDLVEIEMEKVIRTGFILSIYSKDLSEKHVEDLKNKLREEAKRIAEEKAKNTEKGKEV